MMNRKPARHVLPSLGGSMKKPMLLRVCRRGVLVLSTGRGGDVG